MNIVYLTNQFPPNIWGGMGIFVNLLAEKITRYNHKIWVYTTNPGYLDFFEERGNIKIYRPVNPLIKKILQKKKSKGYYTIFLNVVKIVDLFFNNLSCFFLLKKNLKKDKYHLIVVHDFMHSLTGILCKLFMDVPVIFHVHFVEYTMTEEGRRKDPLGVIRFFEGTLAKKAENIIVGTPEMKELMVKHKWEPSKITIVPLCNTNDVYENYKTPGPDVLARVEKTKLDLGIRPDERVILYVGRLISIKGVFNLIAAMRIIVKKVGKVKLVLVGEGNRRKLNNAVRSLDLQDYIHLYHRFLSHEEVLNHYHLADICIFPSIQEPFGLVALEAMSVGKPVVLGYGFSRIFEGDREKPNLLYANPADPMDIAEKAVMLLTDEKNAAEMGFRAQRYVKENFRQDKTVHLTLQTYQQVIDAYRGKACEGFK